MIFLHILKITGIVLLCILAFILLVLLYILLVPIGYRISYHNAAGELAADMIKAEACVHTLFRTVRFRAGLKDGRSFKSLKILWIEIFRNEDQSDDEKEPSPDAEKKQKEPQETEILSEDLFYDNDHDLDLNFLEKQAGIYKDDPDLTAEAVKNPETPGNTDEDEGSPDTEKEEEWTGLIERAISFIDSFNGKSLELQEKAADKSWQAIDAVNNAAEKTEQAFEYVNRAPENIGKAAENFGNKAKESADSVKEKAGSAKDKALSVKKKAKLSYRFISGRAVKEFAPFALKIVKKLLHHVRIRKLKADLRVGTGEPDTTGYLTGAVAALSAAFKKHISFTPDFENAIAKGYLECSGHVCLIVPVFCGLKVLFSKEFRRFKKTYKKYRRLMKKA
ncbi:MAG: hypothetical protein VZR00_02860 [Lachnospiraceae bacterium]|jgi:hypothetical protein|nr:hypothetical protein [Lachnospiraceae bacterium]MEE3460817.1 hypothetical protein [Lachnospiraceae bacterium]